MPHELLLATRKTTKLRNFFANNMSTDMKLSTAQILHHPLNNIETTNYFNYESRSNGVFSRNNLTRIKDGANLINLDDKNSKGIH